MSTSIFDEAAITPNDEMISSVLGDSKTQWDNALSEVESLSGKLNDEWKFYSKASGWSFVVKSNKRTILYLIPQDNYFKANFVFGDKAVNAAEIAPLPQDIIDLIKNSKKNMEGRSFMIDVANEESGEYLKTLIKIKAEN